VRANLDTKRAQANQAACNGRRLWSHCAAERLGRQRNTYICDIALRGACSRCTSRPQPSSHCRLLICLRTALYRDWLRTEYPQSRDDLLIIDEPLRRIQISHGLRYGGLHNEDSLRNINRLERPRQLEALPAGRPFRREHSARYPVWEVRFVNFLEANVSGERLLGGKARRAPY